MLGLRCCVSYAFTQEKVWLHGDLNNEHDYNHQIKFGPLQLGKPREFVPDSRKESDVKEEQFTYYLCGTMTGNRRTPKFKT